MLQSRLFGLSDHMKWLSVDDDPLAALARAVGLFILFRNILKKIYQRVGNNFSRLDQRHGIAWIRHRNGYDIRINQKITDRYSLNG